MDPPVHAGYCFSKHQANQPFTRTDGPSFAMKPHRIQLLAVAIAALAAAALLALLTPPKQANTSRQDIQPHATKSRRAQARDLLTAHSSRDTIAGGTDKSNPVNPSELDPGVAAPQVAEPAASVARSRRLNDAWQPVAQAGPWIATNSSAPGHQLSQAGLLASVVAYQEVPASHSVALSVLIDNTPQTGGAPDAPLPASTDTGSASLPHTGRPFAGLTYEQQLFRTKWGWLAYNQMQLALSNTSIDAP
jgi:hypothetical protein